MTTTTMSEFYSYSATSIDGREVSMSEYAGKTILIVNVASNCGFTPQYEGLEALYRKYKDKNFVILGFPCNQFGGQEPGDEQSIQEGCLTEYGVTFPMFSKVKVNGRDAHPLFKYLKKALPGMPGGRVKWNFTKFLVDGFGRPVERFGSGVSPEKIDGRLVLGG